MPWNVLIFPLLAGYIYLSRAYYFKFSTERLDRQRLIFESVIAAFILLSCALIARNILFRLEPETCHAFRAKVPFDQIWLLTSIGTLPISLIAVGLTNLVLKKEKSLDRAISTFGSNSEIILYRAFKKGNMVMLTMKNSKVYVGLVKEMPYISSSVDHTAQSVSLVPLISGYRHAEHKDVILTTEYSSAVLSLDEGKADKLEIEIALPYHQISSTSFFDIDFYESFNKDVQVV